MGLFDELLGAAKGAALNAGESGAQGILNQVLGQVSEGGLGGILEKLQASGLGDQVASWMANGHNLPVSVDQLQAALGNEHVTQIASALGIDPATALQHLAEHLPGMAESHAAG
jgi:uncharacterized protein YidB (DUF937 family)